MAAARAAWRDWQASLDPARLVFIDETGASTAMARRCGRAKRGERVVAPVPHWALSMPSRLAISERDFTSPSLIHSHQRCALATA